MVHIADAVWNLLSEGYAEVKGGLNYSSVQVLIDTSAIWEIAVADGEILAVTIFKAKQGLKLVAMSINSRFRVDAKRALKQMIRSRLDQCWMELSGAAEHFVMNHCDGVRYLLSSSLASTLLGKSVRSSTDSHHYYRTIMGHEKEKVALGTPHLCIKKTMGSGRPKSACAA